LTVAQWKVADTLAAMGRWRESLEHNRRALAVMQDLPSEPTDVMLSRFGYLSFGHRRIADALAALGESGQAMVECQASLDALDRWTEPLDNDRQRQRGRINALRCLGEALAALGRHDEALQRYQQCLSVIDVLLVSDGPQNVWTRFTQSRVLALMSAAHLAQRDLEGALSAAQRAVDVAASLAEVDGDNIESRHAHGRALLTLARAHLARDEHDQAQGIMAQAVAALQAAATAAPEHALASRDLAEARRLLSQ
jgi:tetratricopeptide (TPR) repeat protein